MKDIAAFRQQIHSHNSAMQSSFQMINVLLLLKSGSSQESISRVLGDLKTQIGRVEVAVQTRNDAEPPSTDLQQDNERISRNLRQFVRVAESFHSSASTVVGEGTVWGGSVYGDPLSDDQAQRIENWIPPPTIQEEGPEINNSLSGTTEDVEQDSDPDSDMERDFVKNFHGLAISSFTAGDFPNAEKFFNKVVSRSTEDLPGGVSKVKLMQAYAYGKQSRWRDAENVLASLIALKKTSEPMAFDGLHALALLKLQGDAHDSAIRYCKKALMGRRRLGGKDSASFHESMALLALIHERRGDMAEAEGCRGFLPGDYNEDVDVGFLQYLARPLKDHIPEDKVAVATNETRPSPLTTSQLTGSSARTSVASPVPTPDSSYRNGPARYSPPAQDSVSRLVGLQTTTRSTVQSSDSLSTGSTAPIYPPRQPSPSGLAQPQPMQSPRSPTQNLVPDPYGRSGSSVHSGKSSPLPLTKLQKDYANPYRNTNRPPASYQPPAPTHAAHTLSWMSARSNERLVIGIDLGSTETSVAFAYFSTLR